MTAMHPDSGVPPQDARNSLPNNVEQSQNCDELWYSTSRCEPRFDAAAANAVLAELINLINRGEVVYDCNFLDQVERSVRYIVQRGIPRGGLLEMGPQNYSLTLDPAITRYNDYMTLTVVPSVNNTPGPAYVNVNGKGLVQILRNDATPLVKGDLKTGRPILIVYYQGYFYVPSFVDSQIPKIQTGAIDLWVRTDGNDVTGDGTANSADKAFKTISGAWQRVANQFIASPILPLNIRLGIPGDYEGASLGPYGGPVNLFGDESNKSGYRIKQVVSGDIAYNLRCTSCTLSVYGCTLMLQVAVANCWMAVADNGSMYLQEMEYQIYTNAPSGVVFLMVAGGVMTTTKGQLVHSMGGTFQMNSIWSVNAQSLFWGASPYAPANVSVQNITITTATVVCNEVSVCRFYSMTVTSSGVTGTKYVVTMNSTFATNGQTVPGSVAGSASTGGQVL